MPGIFVMREDGSFVPMTASSYGTEDELQSLLETYPQLLQGEEINPESHARYFLVKREAGIPASEGAADRWSLDHLFLDRDGVPTLVEVKRASDTRIRREVIGQMMDYAANILRHWPPERMQAEFEARCKDALPSLDAETEVRTVTGLDYEEFWQRVKINLSARKLRLVFLADEIPDTLRTIVEYLNEEMTNTEVLAVEVRQHKGEGLTTLVSQVIGDTSTAKQTKSVGERRQWDESMFFDELARVATPEQIRVQRRLLDWAQQCEREGRLRVTWGVGAVTGGAMFGVGNPARNFCSIATKPSVSFNFVALAQLPAFHSLEARLDFIRRINEIPGFDLPESAVDQTYTPRDPALIAGEADLARFLTALNLMLTKANTG